MVKRYSQIEFNKTREGYKHNIGDDFACFIVWKSGRPYLDKIRTILARDFEILLETDIQWTEEHFDDNANRLYENLINKNISKERRKSRHRKKIGSNRFTLYIVKDANPQYTYAQSVSGKIELSNLNVVDAKYEMRGYILAKTGVKYGVHSTNSIYEFFFQVPLLLGAGRFKRLMGGERINESKICKDLEGAGEWRDYEGIFQILNLTTNYLVQRSFETLPKKNEELDIDVLTDHCQRLASAIGAEQHPEKPYKGKIIINGEEISLDIRYVGDKYYNPVWSRTMLDGKVFKNGLYIPRKDDYFFSLLYHCKVQKPQVKKKYFGILERLAEELNFKWFTLEKLKDNNQTGKLIKGFMESEGYYYEDPVDPRVYKNQEVIRHLPFPISKSIPKTTKQKVKARVGHYLPKKVKKLLKKIWRKLK